MVCFVVAGFLLTSASCGPSDIAELLVNLGGPIHISGMAEARAVKFCYRWAISSITKRIKNHSQNGRVYGHVIYEILNPPYDISGMAKAKDFKLCTVFCIVEV